MSMAVADPEAVANILGTGTQVENTILRAGGVANRRTTTPSGVKIDNSDNIQMAANTWLGRGAAASRHYFDESDGSIEYHAVGTGSHKFTGSVTMSGNITMPEDGWIGIGAAAERIVFDGTGGQVEVRGAYLFIEDNNHFQFRDSDLYISSKADGYLDFDADTGFRFNTATSIQVAEDTWLGTGAAETRIIFDNSTDRIQIANGSASAEPIYVQLAAGVSTQDAILEFHFDNNWRLWGKAYDGTDYDFWIDYNRNSLAGNFYISAEGVSAFMVDPVTQQVGIGTTTVPHGGVGAAKLAIEGTNASATAGPYIQITTDLDDFPTMQMGPWSHDNMWLGFDMYLNPSATFVSGDAGSNFIIRKNGDILAFSADNGIAQGFATNVDVAFQIESDAEVLFSPSAARSVFWRDTLTHINSPASGILALHGGSYVRVGGAAASHSLGADGDFLVSGELEVDGSAHFDSSIICYTNNSGVIFNESTTAVANLTYRTDYDQVVMYLGAGVGRQIIIAGSGYWHDFDHAVAADPYLIVHSDTDPDSDNTQYGGFFHDKTDFNVVVGKGDLIIDCPSQKTVELAEPVWEDIQFHMSTGLAIGGSTPTWAPLTTNVYAYKFGVNDGIEAEFQELNHKWKEGGTGHFHLHLVIDVAQSTGSDRFAKFNAYVAFANAGTGVYGETTLTAELTIPTGSAAKQEFYLDMGDIAFTSRTIGTQVGVTVERIAATGGTEYADDVFVTQCGAHIEQIRIGSRSQAAA
jgi:hypothetical protein